MEKTQLYHQLQEIIANGIHLAKCNLGDKISHEVWKGIDSKQIADEAMVKIQEMLELWSYIPCCHVSGTHDPTHFEEGKRICNDQKAEAFDRFCKDIGVNPVVRSKPYCSWCNNYPDKRKGEGLKLFMEEKAI